jgi:hypothetical protein
MSLNAFLFQLKDSSSIVEAKIMTSGRVEPIIPDVPAIVIFCFWFTLCVYCALIIYRFSVFVKKRIGGKALNDFWVWSGC